MANNNIYHITYHKPALERWHMLPEREAQAVRLVQSGRLRIDDEPDINFVRFDRPAEDIHLAFSYREIMDTRLKPRTEQLIMGLLSHHHPENIAKSITKRSMVQLNDAIGKHLKVPLHKEIKIARLLVQSCEPAVMELLLLEQAEIFVTFSETVGDVLDLQSWQQAGTASGLQMQGHLINAVCIATGGNPFYVPPKLKKDEEQFFFVDESRMGVGAQARLMVIAGQEIGHFSDMVRASSNGQVIGRFSTNLYATRAHNHMRLARKKDIHQCQLILNELLELGLAKLTRLAREHRFYKKQTRRYIKIGFLGMLMRQTERSLIRKAKRRPHLAFVEDLAKQHSIGRHLYSAIEDMLFNLSPNATAYKRDDSAEEEAIACVEAIARVPQQTIKWGHLLVASTTPHLYDMYYRDIVPACAATCEQLSGTPFSYKGHKLKWWHKFYLRMRYRDTKNTALHIHYAA